MNIDLKACALVEGRLHVALSCSCPPIQNGIPFLALCLCSIFVSLPVSVPRVFAAKIQCCTSDEQCSKPLLVDDCRLLLSVIMVNIKLFISQHRCWREYSEWYDLPLWDFHQHRCSQHCEVPRCVLGSWWSYWARPGSEPLRSLWANHVNSRLKLRNWILTSWLAES